MIIIGAEGMLGAVFLVSPPPFFQGEEVVQRTTWNYQ
jgi:hypothetical protein